MSSNDRRRHQHADVGSADAGVRITVIVQDRYSFETDRVTGAMIREAANIPAGFALHRRSDQGNEPIADDAEIVIRDGDHFFARPTS